MLKSIYGNGVEKVKLEHRTFQKEGGSTKVDINTLSSNFHIEINPSDAGKGENELKVHVVCADQLSVYIMLPNYPIQAIKILS